MAFQTREELTPREIQTQQFEKEMFDKQAQQVLAVKQLELELAKLEAKWSSWLRIPMTIVKLPVYLVLALGFVVAAARKFEVEEDFWELLRK